MKYVLLSVTMAALAACDTGEPGSPDGTSIVQPHDFGVEPPHQVVWASEAGNDADASDAGDGD